MACNLFHVSSECKTQRVLYFVYSGMMDENNEQFVAYFLPTEETLTKRHQDEQTGIAYTEDEV